MDLGTVVASSWSAGISLYAVAAVLGIAGRLDWITVSPALENPWVIGAALVLLAVEFVVDKIALLDSVWDAINTVIRPAGAAWIAAAAPDQELPLPVLAIVGAALALSSHSAKASARALINTSPEPASNIVASLVEDGIVGVVMALAIAYPKIAFVVTVFLAIATSITAVLLYKAIRGVWSRIRRRFGRGDPTVPATG
ncbi:MAG: DUF4126 domain-containing protein [Acidimicrobiales bacterium]|jgi:hypothetical protein|nr:DUF4126 domain-containing protein [Acidimicrobiales bacterium]